MDLEPYRKEPLVLTFDPRNAKQTVAVTIRDKTVYLDATEANDLLEWLYRKRDTLFQLENQKGLTDEPADRRPKSRLLRKSRNVSERKYANSESR